MDESKIEHIKKNSGLYGIWTLDLSDTGAVQLYDFHIFTAIYSPLHGFIWNQHSDHYCEDRFYIHFILSFRYGVSGFPTIKFFPRDSEEAEEVSCIT